MPIGAQGPGGTADGPSALPANLRGPMPEQITPGGATLVRRVATIAYHNVAGQSDPAPASGIMDVIFDEIPGEYIGLVERVYVETDSTTETEATLYIGDPDTANSVDFTRSGNRDLADNFQPIMIPGGFALRIRWEGASLGARGVARAQYRIAQVVGEG